MSELPKGWEWATVGEVATVQLGRQRSPQHHHGQHMRPYLRAANVTWNGFDLNDVKEMNFEPSEAQVFALKPGDILLNEASGSPNEVGKPAIWRGEISSCCFQNTLLRVRALGSLTEYLYWYFRHAAIEGQFGEAGRGVNIRHLGKAGLAGFPIPVPPRAEQERIVATIEERFSHLDAADNYLSAGTRRLAPLRRSLLSRAVPVDAPTMSLDDLLVDIEAGKSFKTPGRAAEEGEWGVIKVSAMTWGEFRPSENKAIPSDQEVNLRYEIRPGDLLLSRANTSEYVGATVLVDDCPSKLLMSDKSMRLVVRDGVDKRWLLWALSSPQLRQQMSRVATGTSDSMRNISQEKVRRLRLSVPDEACQRRLADQIANELERHGRFSDEIARARIRGRALRRAILAAAFSGRLVPDDPSDEPASVQLERVRSEREAARKSPPRLSRTTA